MGFFFFFLFVFLCRQCHYFSNFFYNSFIIFACAFSLLLHWILWQKKIEKPWKLHCLGLPGICYANSCISMWSSFSNFFHLFLFVFFFFIFLILMSVCIYVCMCLFECVSILFNSKFKKKKSSWEWYWNMVIYLYLRQ